jgi:hypothetical protein
MYSQTGWWYYFPVALVLKDDNPVAVDESRVSLMGCRANDPSSRY